MVKATKLSSPPEWAEPRVAVVAFVSSDFCDACSALATRLNVLQLTELQNREILEPTKEHSVIHIYQLCVLAGCKVSEGYRYKITAPSGWSVGRNPSSSETIYSALFILDRPAPFRSGAFVWPPPRPPSSSIDIFPLHRRNVSWRRCLGRV